MHSKKKAKAPKPEPFEKLYALPPWRGRFLGFMLMLVGLTFTFMNISFSDSWWDNVQTVLIDFRAWDSFFLSLIMLLFKAGLTAAGFFYFKYATGVVRAKIDQKGFYYQTIPKGNKYDMMAIDLNKLSYISYGQIKDICYRKSWLTGGHIDMETDEGKVTLVALDALRDADKQDIVTTIKAMLSLKQQPAASGTKHS